MFISLFLRLLLAYSCLVGPAFAAGGTVLVYGDSLSAGFGIAVEQSWPALLNERLRKVGAGETAQWSAKNASISGETTAGGRSRFAAALDQFKPSVVILALGANDGLRGLPVTQMTENLTAMAQVARKKGARVLIIGMRLPPNYGPAYNKDFEQAFITVAKTEKAALLPFLLEPIAGERENFQPDGLHPVAAAQPRILDHVYPHLKPLLK